MDNKPVNNIKGQKIKKTSKSAIIGLINVGDYTFLSNPVSIEGNIVRIRRIQIQRKTPTKIVVKNLPKNKKVTKEEITDILKSYGKILKVEVVKNRSNDRCKGYAFVTFVDKSSFDQLNKNNLFMFKNKQL